MPQGQKNQGCWAGSLPNPGPVALHGEAQEAKGCPSIQDLSQEWGAL